MTSLISSLFSRDPKSVFPYELPSSSFYTFDGISVGKSFKKAEPSEYVTCFWASLSEYGPGSVLKSQARKLKTLRHPNVLVYLDSIEINGMFYLITETCVPLKIYVTQNHFSGTQKDLVISWGLFQLMNCLKFLHQEAKLSHEDIRHSVYVTKSGDWKLGGFEKSVSFSNPRVDLNSLALLTWEIFNGFDESKTKPEGPKKVPERLQEHYKKMATSQAAKQDSGDLLRELRRAGGFFKNRYVDTLLFLDEFQLKEPHEKQVFFSELKNELDIFPDDVAKYRILPKLIHSYEYGDAGSHVLTPLFHLGRLLDENEYQQRIVPCLCKLFSSPDRVTRVKLLEKIDEFISHLTFQIVNEKIYGNIVSGFMDTSPAVRESTVKAVVSLAEKLSSQNLNIDLMRHLARLQGSDDQPGIRTNATICLGKIGCYIDPNQRQRILISAFTRALKDPFPPARMAAILALSATQQYYSLVEVANRILPALSPITCDPEKQVRDQSFKALHGFIEKLEKASENPELIPELEAQVKAGGKNGLLGSDKVPQWANWAIKALSSKFYKSSAQNPLSPTNKEDACRQESVDSTSKSSALKLHEVSPETFLNDDCGELEDNSSVEDKWEDADDTIAAHSEKTTDGWDDNWEGITEKKDPFTTLSSSLKKSSIKTGLNLQSTAKKLGAEDDLDYLLDIKSEPSAFDQIYKSGAKSKNSLLSKNTGNALTDGWNDSSFIDGWEDDISSVKKSSSVSNAGDWDSVLWDVYDQKSTRPVAETKNIFGEKIAALDETNREEMARKRTVRGLNSLHIKGIND